MPRRDRPGHSEQALLVQVREVQTGLEFAQLSENPVAQTNRLALPTGY